MDVYARTYFENIAFPSGNLSVVALVAGDVNYRVQANYEPVTHVVMAFGMVSAIANVAWACYIYKLMLKQMKNGNKKKYTRTIATTCVEVEIILNILKIVTWIDPVQMRGIFPYPIFFIFAAYQNDLANFTTILLVFYWFNLTSSKGMKKNVSFT